MLLVHFDSHAQLQAWIGSEQRRRLVDELRSERPRTGMGLWFALALAGARQAKPFKQFLLTFSAIYPLSLAVPAILCMLTKGWSLPTGLVQLCASALLVWLMVYVVMPRYVKAASSWLFR